MKKVLIAYSKEEKLKGLVEGLKAGFESNGAKVDVEEIPSSSRNIYFGRYDLVILGSLNLGLFGGKIDSKISGFLENAKRTSGQETVVFVQERFWGRSKALKSLMEKLEGQGCVVKDFREFKDKASAKKYAQRFKL